MKPYLNAVSRTLRLFVGFTEFFCNRQYSGFRSRLVHIRLHVRLYRFSSIKNRVKHIKAVTSAFRVDSVGILVFLKYQITLGTWNFGGNCLRKSQSSICRLTSIKNGVKAHFKSVASKQRVILGSPIYPGTCEIPDFVPNIEF